jgi:hypothetical protein
MKLELPANAIRFVAEKSAKFHTTNRSTPVKNIAKYVQQIPRERQTDVDNKSNLLAAIIKNFSYTVIIIV